MPAPWRIHMRGDGSDVLNDARFLPGFKLKIIGFRVSLVTHLCNHLVVFPGGFHHQLNFIKSTCHWFLNIHMFAQAHGHHGNREM
ncbi:hypothetical protein D3C86_1688690 [compost metagenome]